MFGIEHYMLFIISGIILNITPGTDTLYIVARSVSQGRMAGIISVLGVSSGAVIHTLLAAFGLSIILTKSILVFNIIKYIGAAYLCFLGIKMLMEKSDSQQGVKKLDEHPLRKIYIQGVITNLFNPKVALFFIAFLPQFVSSNNHYGVVPFLILGFTFICTATIWCLMVVLFSSHVTSKLRSNGRMSILLNKVTGDFYWLRN